MNGKSGESSSFTILSSELCDIIKKLVFQVKW